MGLVDVDRYTLVLNAVWMVCVLGHVGYHHDFRTPQFIVVALEGIFSKSEPVTRARFIKMDVCHFNVVELFVV